MASPAVTLHIRETLELVPVAPSAKAVKLVNLHVLRERTGKSYLSFITTPFQCLVGPLLTAWAVRLALR